ncbi:hypothetical protein C8J57DRAFT_1320034 [Mycena rebaudengoi]|nr:hypothetical protein C8J57DRAFT_1320034 [Mycena rebaudengoi]
MNYASVITVGVLFLSLVWCFAAAHRHYKGPATNVQDHDHDHTPDDDLPTYEKVAEKEKVDMA